MKTPFRFFPARFFLLLFLTIIPLKSLEAGDICVEITEDTVAPPSECLTVCNALATCSLNDAISKANSDPGPDRIIFGISGAGPHVISLTASLPIITETLEIDGYTQAGAIPNSLPPDQGLNTVLKIVLDDGASVTAGLLLSASDSTIRGLVIQNFDIGIQIGGDNNKIEGNFFGTDVTGTSVEANIIGVSLVGGTDNFIGVDANNEEARNLISGNINAGIAITAATLVSQPHNHIRGNLIGTDITGLAALGNTFFGIQITDSDGSDIGGDSPFQRNVISANGAAGIVIGGTPAESVNNVITGNYIGTGVDGETDLGNQGSGIALGLGAAATEIGRIFSPGQGNRIAFNAFGISIDNSDGIFGIGILNNSIFSNDFIGIDLESNGVVTPNDPGDGDTGPNGLQNFPILSAATVDDGNLVVEGDLDSVSGQFRVEFFVNDVCSPTGNGEGKTFVGSVDVDTSVDEHFSVSFAAQPGAFVTATASRNLGFETSEFSPCQAIVAEICDNGLDDEGDGDSDCDDADCAAFPACAPSPSCGNGTLESGEQCDDGNTTNGDGCNSNCQQETSGGGGGCGLAGTVSAPPSFALSIYLLVLSTIAATRKLRRRSFPST